MKTLRLAGIILTVVLGLSIQFLFGSYLWNEYISSYLNTKFLKGYYIGENIYLCDNKKSYTPEIEVSPDNNHLIKNIIENSKPDDELYFEGRGAITNNTVHIIKLYELTQHKNPNCLLIRQKPNQTSGSRQ